MIFSLPPQASDKKTEDDELPGDDRGIDADEPHYEYRMEKSAGLQLEDDQYIIDPDYMGPLGIDNFEDLIKTRR